MRMISALAKAGLALDVAHGRAGVGAMHAAARLNAGHVIRYLCKTFSYLGK